MTVTYLPYNDIEDERVRANFEYLENHGIFDSTSLYGDLTGTLPNPTVDTVLGGKRPASAVVSLSGSGNCPYQTITAPTPGVYLLLLRALGPNIDDNQSYIWQVHGGNVQSAVVVLAHSYYNNTPCWGVGFGGEVTLTMGQSASMGYQSTGNANQVSFNTTNSAVSTWYVRLNELAAAPA